MARYLCVLVYLAACLLRGASGQNSTACSVDIPLAKLESLLTVSSNLLWVSKSLYKGIIETLDCC